MIRLLGIALFALSMAGCAGFQDRTDGPVAAIPAARAGDPLVARLADGGYVLYIRHGKTDSTYQDKPQKPEWWKSCDTRTHRPLSDEGRAQMQNLGHQMRELRLPVAKVVASEYCRAVDSALLLQLMPVTQDAALNYTDAQRYINRQDEQIAAGFRALFSAVPPAGRNTLLIGHVHGFNPPLDPVFMQIAEAETVVIKPLGAGRFEIVGRITADKWALRAK